MSGCCAPTFGTAGPRLPGGRGRGSPVPTQSPILSVALHARRFDPERQLRPPTPRATKPRMHAGVSVPRRTPNYPRGADRKPPRRYRTGGSPPIHIAVRKEVTPRYARPRGLSHNTVSVHTIHVTSAQRSRAHTPTRGGRPSRAVETSATSAERRRTRPTWEKGPQAGNGVVAVCHGASGNCAVDAHARDEAHAAACTRTNFTFFVCRAPRRLVLVWQLGAMFNPVAESQATC